MQDNISRRTLIHIGAAVMGGAALSAFSCGVSAKEAPERIKKNEERRNAVEKAGFGGWPSAGRR